MIDTTIKNELSIIIPAWEADKWINNCLTSIYNQSWIKNNSNWEILVGIDYCIKTLNSLKPSKNLKSFFFKEHCGPYIIRNTLAYKEAKYSNLLYFDSDDLMKHDLISSCFILNKPFITFQYTNILNKITTSCGSSFLKKDLLFKYGGYQSWLCAADSDFIKRITADGWTHSKLIGKNYMIRGSHNKQLTIMSATSGLSSLRQNYWSQTIENLKNKKYYVNPTFKDYVRI